jgi:hypothetical protein
MAKRGSEDLKKLSSIPAASVSQYVAIFFLHLDSVHPAVPSEDLTAEDLA